MKAVDFKYPKFSEEVEKQWKGPFFFVQGADSQFGMFSTFVENKEVPDWEKEKILAKICVEKINSMSPKPKFFVICGDLTDAMPDSENSLKYKTQQEADFIEIFSGIDKDIPLVCVCGNHDVGNQPSIETVKRYRSVFGCDYFSFWAGGIQFLVMNSQYYFDGSQIKELVKEQDEWLTARLLESNHRGAVIFQHIPHFIRSHDETDAGYFSLPIETRIPLLDKLYNGGVRHVFCGHYHRNAGGFYKDMEVVVTSAIGCQLGEDKSGVRIVKVNEDKISHQYYAFEEIPSQIKF